MGVNFELAKIHDQLYRFDFCHIPDGSIIKEVWYKDGKQIEILTNSPWDNKNEDDEREWRRGMYEKKYIEEFLEWLGFKPLEEEN